MSTINNKLKAAVKASLTKEQEAKAVKKSVPRKKAIKKQNPEDEPEASKMDDRTREYLGIPKATARPRERYVYMVKYHNRARLDHTKYPNERCHKLENSPMFATHDEADKWCRRKEKEDPENLYFSDPSWIPEPEIPKDIMKKILKRGW